MGDSAVPGQKQEPEVRITSVGPVGGKEGGGKSLPNRI